MKAIVKTKSGAADHLKLQEVDKPVPHHDEILVKVHAATVTIGDVRLRRLGPLFRFVMRLAGYPPMRTPGIEMAGVVEAVGKDVKRFRVGDPVFGTTTGLRFGANAEYVCVPEEWEKGVVAIKPANATFEEAAPIPVGAMTALHILRRADIQQGQGVLVYGASGSVGTYAVQLAKHWGAEVTGVCRSANHEMVMSLGADHVIDYTKEDFTKSGQVYDVIFDAVIKLSRSDATGSLKPNGTYLSASSPTSEATEDLNFLGKLVVEGKLRAAIDRQYTLEQVPDAHRYVEKGHKKGNVVITVVGNDRT
jgi:NADPH:quinone reductase-like Zn-dependent oxidoreductase